MKVIIKDNKVIYRADIGKKVHYENDLNHFYSEIVVKKETDAIKEVKEK